MHLLCKNCGAPVMSGSQYWCSYDCRREYNDRGFLPRPPTVRKLNSGVCWGCGRQLTGRQIKWCSDPACRSRARLDQRMAQTWQPTPAERNALEQKFRANKLHKKPALTGLWGDHPGRVRYATLKTTIRCTQVVPGLGMYAPEYHLTNAQLRAIYRDILEGVMNREVFGYVVEVFLDR